MAILTRAQAATELANRGGAVLLAVGLTTADTAGNLKEPVDGAFGALGVPYASLPTATLADTDLPRFLAVGAFYSLQRALTVAAGFADVSASSVGVSKSASQVVDNLTKLIPGVEAAAVAVGFGDLLRLGMTRGAYDTDVIEPDAMEYAAW